MELGVANDMVFNETNSKQKNGAVGLLTHNQIDRVELYRAGVVLALIPFVNQGLY
jgi:non-canonical (house-cleaning) NTP pyrophosphatase